MFPDIDDPYVDGVSITHGHHPRKHVWTLASGIVQYTEDHHLKKTTCPGVGGNPQQTFVANNYYCSSGNPTRSWSRTLYDLPLWSSLALNCQCSDHERYGNAPLFCVKLPETTRDGLELRICTDQSLDDEDVRIDHESFDFYIK